MKVVGTTLLFIGAIFSGLLITLISSVIGLVGLLFLLPSMKRVLGAR